MQIRRGTRPVRIRMFFVDGPSSELICWVLSLRRLTPGTRRARGRVDAQRSKLQLGSTLVRPPFRRPWSLLFLSLRSLRHSPPTISFPHPSIRLSLSLSPHPLLVFLLIPPARVPQPCLPDITPPSTPWPPPTTLASLQVFLAGPI